MPRFLRIESRFPVIPDTTSRFPAACVAEGNRKRAGPAYPAVSVRSEDWATYIRVHVLEITGQIILVPPYFENFGKRLIKSPKVYLGDSGLACNLLGITSPAELERSPFLGALFEGLVAAEILKNQVNQGRHKELYHFRDQQGLEVDFLFPSGHGGVWMVECKASKTVQPGMARPLGLLSQAMGSRAPVRSMVVHRASTTAPPSRVVSPGAEALDVRAFVNELASPSKRVSKARRRPHEKT